MHCETVSVTSNRQVRGNVYEMTLPCSHDTKPGQFYMVKSESGSTLLPRAISICDHDGSILTLLYQVVGRGTGELSSMSAGDRLVITGPLGNGFPLDGLNDNDKIALVCGGIGIAPMLLTAKKLKEKGVAADCYCGFRDDTFLTDELESYTDRLVVATESGASGEKGFVTAHFNPSGYSAVFCCGPEPMMKAVTGLCIGAGTPVYVSMESKMACGMGACLVCTCADQDGKNLRTCKDGPVFRGEVIDFDA